MIVLGIHVIRCVSWPSLIILQLELDGPVEKIIIE